MSSKQQGISNTETKHSVDIANDPEKSKKGEGYPETAKVVGTVRTDRPQVSFTLILRVHEYFTNTFGQALT